MQESLPDNRFNVVFAARVRFPSELQNKLNNETMKPDHLTQAEAYMHLTGQSLAPPLKLKENLDYFTIQTQHPQPMNIEQAKTKALSKKEQELHNVALIAAVISNTYFHFIVANRKNSYTTYEFIAEMAMAFSGYCKAHKYVMGKDPVLDREGIINWCKDALAQHPDFKDVNDK
jgi:hypothetical protein